MNGGKPKSPGGTKYDKLVFPIVEVSMMGKARYEYTAGEALGKFLQSLKDGKILGTVCDKCGRVFIPPRLYCSYCFREVDRWIEASDEGVVITAALSYIAADRSKLEKPVTIGVVKLDVVEKKYDDHFFPGLMHYLCGFTEEDVKSMKIFGARVKARWKPNREGSIRDIECFEKI